MRLAIAGQDTEAGSERRTLTRRRWHHPVRNDGGTGRIHPGRRKAGVICRLHRHLHRAKREIMKGRSMENKKISYAYKTE